MEQARWNQIEDLLQAALDLHPHERAEFLTRECGGDPALQRELEELLAQEAEGSILETPAVAGLVPPPVFTGQRISHYRIDARIGAGGMGEVYEAHDEVLNRTVAIKVLSSDFTADAERVRRLEQEAFAASRLNDPNIITIYEVVHAGEMHCIVTERVEGQTLRELGRKLPVEKALDIAMQVAAALKAAHTAWIIHRDIKPENIMLRADGLVKVVDFGIAKLKDEPAADDARSPRRSPAVSPNLTVPGAILGTANYMSPEQARGEPLDGRTDLYSLGLVLREVVAGPLPRELQRIIRRMLQPDRELRYSSAAELLDDLRGLKRRLESRAARRLVGVSALAVVAALTITAIAAMLSVNEAWDERVLRDGHTAAARQAAFSPDGRLLASCSEDGRVIVWDFARRERLATLDHPSYKVAFSPDGRWLATGGTDGTIVIWDGQGRKRLRALTLQNRRPIGALAFSPDSALLASASDDPQGRSVLWDTDNWQPRHVWPRAVTHGTFAFSPDGQQLLSSAELRVWDMKGGLLSQDNGIGLSWVAVSPDAARMAAIDFQGDVLFYRFAARGNLARHELISRVEHAHQDHGRAVAYSPDGSLVVSAADDIVLWDAATRQKVARFEHPSIVWNVAFSPNGRWLASTHGDGAVLVWDVAERRLAANFNEHSASVRAVAFAADGQRVASAGEDRTVTVWDAQDGHKLAVLTDHQTRVTSLSFSRKAGALLASGDQDGMVILWDLETRLPRLTIRPPVVRLTTYCSTMSPDGRFLATSHAIYRTSDGRPLVGLWGMDKDWRHGNVYGASFSADGRRAAVVTDTGWIILADLERGAIVERRRVAETHQISVSLSPDGKWLVTGEDEGAVRLWTIDPLREAAILGRHAARVKSVAFAPDGATVASAGDDKMIALWDVERRALRTRIGTHASPVYSVAFSPDGRRLVSGEHDRSVRVYTRQRTLWGFRLKD